MNARPINCSRPTNAGNALFLILIAVALFAALSYAVTRTGRGGGSIDRETEILLTAEALQYAAQMADVVMRLKLSGCEDTQISFDSAATGTFYDNPLAPADESCHVFSTNGGGMTYRAPDPRLLDSSQSAMTLFGSFHFTGESEVVDVGTPVPSATSPDGRDLILFIPYLTQSICRKIAQQTNGLVGNNIPVEWNIAYEDRAPGLVSPFKGSYGTGSGFGMNGFGANAAAINGKTVGCFEGESLPLTGTYHFFQVLLAR